MTTKTKNILKMTGILLAGLLLGWIFFGGNDVPKSATEQTEATVWTCSMDPQIRMAEPGSCPICGMDLVRIPEKDDDEDETYHILKRKLIISLIFTVPVSV